MYLRGDRNRTLACQNCSGDSLDTLMKMQSPGQGQVRIRTASAAQVGVECNKLEYLMKLGSSAKSSTIVSTPNNCNRLVFFLQSMTLCGVCMI